MKDLIEIDGSQGEGGGQVLRTAITLSILTGQPVRLEHIRANRSEPGLKPQHLRSVDAAAAISKAEVEGAALRSTSLTFRPFDIRSGRYRFDIGTAGAAALLLQTIFLPLSRAGSASTVLISGGTHVPWSPTFEYLEYNWLPLLQNSGFDARLALDTAGFYPEGGGRLSATIRPAGPLIPLRLVDRGQLRRVTGLSAVVNLDMSIADRQKRRALQRLTRLLPGIEIRIKTTQLPGSFKGTTLFLLAEFEGGRGASSALGKLGKPAEAVAEETVDGLEAFLGSDGAVDKHLADQLLLPLSLAGGASALRTSEVTEHLVTNAAIIRLFLPVRIRVDGQVGAPGLVTIEP